MSRNSKIRKKQRKGLKEIPSGTVYIESRNLIAKSRNAKRWGVEAEN